MVIIDSTQLPDFLIIGTAKAGTTSLYQYLAQHPDIFISEKKEPHFFYLHGASPSFTGIYDQEVWSWMAEPQLEGYLALFADAGKRIKGEASTNYLYYHDTVAPRIYDYNPQMKMIVILRNPVDRAFSAFRHRRSVSREPLASFEDALATEDQRIQAGWDASAHYFYVGLYHSALEHYLTIFPREQIKILVYEQDIRANTQATVRDLFEFLGVSPDVPTDTSTIHNTFHDVNNPVLKQIDRLTRYSDSMQRLKRFLPNSVMTVARGWFNRIRQRHAINHTLHADTRQHLLNKYREDILKTQTLIQRDLSHWLMDNTP